jgi:2-hydroxycyclohexanecarboxyl-CoA dehydrogenase
MSQLSHSSVALVAGGTSGIGLACAKALLQAGTTKLVIAGRDERRGHAATDTLIQAEANAEVHFVPADVSTPAGASEAVQTCIALFGRVDTLVSCAGGNPLPRLLHEMLIEDIGPTISSIVTGIILPARAVLDQMMRQRSGAIVCIASDAGKVATPGEVAIGAAMAAVVMFCRALAIEAKRSGIRINCITPSIVRNTPFYDALMADPFSSRLFSKAEERASLGAVQPEDVAAVAAFLASPATARLTGQTVSVNGGISAA